jgi:predicted metal-dependent phosphoesterase TrpH
MIKAELHAHTDADTADRIPYTAHQLIDHAASLGYGALAITLHDRWTDDAPLADHGARAGVVVLSGIERTIEGKHVLVINAPKEAQRLRTFEDLAALRRSTRALVIAPHAFYPIPSALRSILDRHADLFDAVEINAMHVRGLDFNRKAVAWARAHGKPLVGNSDLHVLEQLGSTYSLVDTDVRTPDGICDAIRSGRVEVVTERLTWTRAARFFTRMMFGSPG